ncbi:hypothetical protein EDB89DRAFT_1985435 [Lactarius sanguifluus]|nr:hypothetical protein EDB89DRAFT_1985435 [Lactarius sanguifluus]
MGKHRKRKAIPAALHSEISEYASLLRVLRATDTLDITTHLTRRDSPHETGQATSVHDVPGQRDSPTSSRVGSKRATSPLDEEASRSSPEGDPVRPERSWKNWTRWPLPFGRRRASHDRSHPIGWESVLNAVGTAGLVDGK